MIYSDRIHDVTLRPDVRGRCCTGLEIMAAVGAASTLASTGMSIIGASQQADAQRMAGETAYQNALIRQNQMEAEAKRLEGEAKQREAVANNQQAAAQRQGIEEKRKAKIAAGRAATVMAASGAGVDTNILDSIMGEGEFAMDAALYEGDTRAQDSRYQAELNKHEAAVRRWEGQTIAAQGGATRSAMNQRASNTMTSGIVKAGIGVASLASKYGGDFFSGGGGSGISKTGVDEAGFSSNALGDLDWSRYNAYGQLS
jgi:hypothetical protein